MPQFTDALGNTISLPAPPQRIISVVPSQTELLHHLGLEQEVVGITKFCVHPKEWYQTKTRVGGTKQLHIDKIRALQPDLVIANKEENTKEQMDAIATFCPVYTTDVATMDDALQMIRNIGTMVQKEREATILSNCIRERFGRIPGRHSPLRVAYIIWKEPYMVAGGDTFINDMLHQCGLVNVFAHEKRYPTIRLQQLIENDCQLLLLSSEPYPFREKDMGEISTSVDGIPVTLVDGEMFSWYGSRMLEAADYFAGLQMLFPER